MGVVFPPRKPADPRPLRNQPVRSDDSSLKGTGGDIPQPHGVPVEQPVHLDIFCVYLHDQYD
jgi:hypothetical protein